MVLFRALAVLGAGGRVKSLAPLGRRPAPYRALALTQIFLRARPRTYSTRTRARGMAVSIALDAAHRDPLTVGQPAREVTQSRPCAGASA